MLTPIPAVLVTPAATNDAHKNLPTWRFRGVPFTGRMRDIAVATLSHAARDGLVFDLEVEEEEVKSYGRTPYIGYNTVWSVLCERNEHNTRQTVL